MSVGIGRLEGKVAWISGATSGIGEATAHLFADEGAKVAVVGPSVSDAKSVADKINHSGNQALAVECDVGVEEDVRKSIERTVAAFGELHIVVNNAGIVHLKPLHLCSEEEFDRVMAINVKSIFFSLKHALAYLRQQSRSYVVNVGSVSSFVGQAGTPIYTTSKHAVLGLTRSIALDYAVDGVRSNAVCPGITDTPMLREHLNNAADPDAALAARLRRVPTGVALSPRDVAKSILFLSCDDSAGITGTSLTIDCGYLAAAEWVTQGKTAFMEPINEHETEAGLRGLHVSAAGARSGIGPDRDARL